MLSKVSAEPRRLPRGCQAKLPLLLIAACFCSGCGRPTIEEATADFDAFFGAVVDDLESDLELAEKYSVFLFVEEPYRIHQNEADATPYTATLKAGVILPKGSLDFAEFEYTFENRKWVLTGSRNPAMPAEDWQRLRNHFVPPQ